MCPLTQQLEFEITVNCAYGKEFSICKADICFFKIARLKNTGMKISVSGVSAGENGDMPVTDFN